METPGKDSAKHDEGFISKQGSSSDVVWLCCRCRSASRQPQECFIYQLFPPSVSPTPSSLAVSPPSPSLSPLALSSLMRVSSVQMLLESSFMHSGLKLTEVMVHTDTRTDSQLSITELLIRTPHSQAPSCLPLLMPRFGKEFKMFDVILPSMSLDITDLLDESEQDIHAFLFLDCCI